MESALALTEEEARAYSKILKAVSKLPKSDPRFALVVGVTWWLLHRRRRLEQQRIRRRQFYRRWRRLLLLRWKIQRNNGNASPINNIVMDTLEEFDYLTDKRAWTKERERSEDFWASIENDEISQEDFYSKFHMTKETFDEIYNELAENLNKSNTSMRESIPGKKRLAATIYRLANNAEYLKVSTLFGIGKSTTTSLVRDVCEVIVTQLKDKFLTWSDPEDGDYLSESETKFGIPQCIGVVGSADVFIIGSTWNWDETSQFTSIYNKTFALVFQAVVDHNGKFCHVSAGQPAGMTNAEILKKSNLIQEMEENFSSYKKTIDDVNIPFVLASDESCPLEECVMTPFNISSDTTDEDSFPSLEVKREFNNKLTQAQSLFGETLLKLKGRWKIFHGKNGKINFNADGFENIALACCILHNICESQGDCTDPSWNLEAQNELFIRSSYEVLEDPNAEGHKNGIAEVEESVRIRNTLASQIL